MESYESNNTYLEDEAEEAVAPQALKQAVGYIRVSTKAQAGDEKCGRAVQQRAIEEYAKTNGYEIVRWFEDVMSGAKDNRPALDAILYGDLENPPYEAVIAFKSDRISRDTKMYFYYLYILERKGVKLISTQEKFDDDPYGLSNIYRMMVMFVAEQERKNIALRTGKGRYVKANAGGHAGGVANYGYKVENKQLVVVPDEAKVVKIVYKMRNDGKSMPQIAAWLNRNGYTTRKGTMITTGLIQSILKNEKLYHGWYKYGKMDDYVAGTHEPILEDERNK